MKHSHTFTEPAPVFLYRDDEPADDFPTEAMDWREIERMADAERRTRAMEGRR